MRAPECSVCVRTLPEGMLRPPAPVLLSLRIPASVTAGLCPANQLKLTKWYSLKECDWSTCEAAAGFQGRVILNLRRHFAGTEQLWSSIT